MLQKSGSLDECFDLVVTDEIQRWFTIWRCEALYDRVVVRFSSRMFRAVGRCYPTRGLLTLAAAVQDLDNARLLDILCHELAHLVAYQNHGRMIKPHGIEWQTLVSSAGHTPRVRTDDPVIIAALEQARRKHRHYRHVCRSCLNERIASRPMPQWRCGPCYELGGDGRLRIIAVGGEVGR